jgi:hypothetical protein
VQATNTTVFFGSTGMFDIYTIAGGASAVSFVDNGGNSGVTVDPTPLPPADPPNPITGDPPGSSGGDPPGGTSGDPPGGTSGDPPGGTGGDPPGSTGGDPPRGTSGGPPGGTSGDPPGGTSGSSPGGSNGGSPGDTTGKPPVSSGNPGSGGGSQSAAPAVQRVVRIVKVNGRGKISVVNKATRTVLFSLYPFGKSYRGFFRVHVRASHSSGVPELIVRTRIGHDTYLTRAFSELDGTRIAVPGAMVVRG